MQNGQATYKSTNSDMTANRHGFTDSDSDLSSISHSRTKCSRLKLGMKYESHRLILLRSGQHVGIRIQHLNIIIEKNTQNLKPCRLIRQNILIERIILGKGLRHHLSRSRNILPAYSQQRTTNSSTSLVSCQFYSRYKTIIALLESSFPHIFSSKYVYNDSASAENEYISLQIIHAMTPSFDIFFQDTP